MSENVLLNNNSFLYELNQKNDQIEYLTNENNQYSQLVYNLQNEIFSLKSKLTIDKEFTRSMKYADEESTFHVHDNDDKKNMWEKFSII